ncbi:VOC family protein [Roseobacter sp. CCS2]|uniref:VOC family protein n=1 Tax=Roseobacter sp. CCS2 TaxID=391593 RepID=UPI0000F403A5|nr:VOC family protein [Roseobacter sp. CCS2]EBA13623.1 glyoxalase family protein [Roseobacter sp. CCS2]
MIVGLDHVQLALPAGAEDQMLAFYCDLLGMTEQAKPAALQGRGGFWARAASLECHFGVDPDFHPATKAHPAFIAHDLDALARRLAKAGYPIKWDTALADVKRFFTADPVGNRIELIATNV